ncbi:glycosyltransferase [Xylanibacter ruminicola]|uniref:Glycosyltransferase involved in cell wall bisynthesis n=1 Tax=Xylanibacter ruminicola TaxID=839 RepID=A0A1M6TB89_XYLRU|nr:glycosyltransferase [Xylanibacter ruminicola]SHK54241.1 Glycosyltransferase involved in cell wall bisynthesis [Xylanibacter ruminicola]
MKIVYAYQQFTDIAGTERILIDKMNYFAERDGYEVFLLTNQQGNHSVVFPLSDKIKRIDLDVCYWELYKKNIVCRIIKGWIKDRLYAKRLLSFVSEINPDIVITSTYFFYILSAIAKCPHPFVRIIESHIDKRYLFEGLCNTRKSVLKRINHYIQRQKLKRIISKYDLLVALNKEDTLDWSGFIKTKVLLNVVHLNPTGKISDQQSKRVIFVGRYVEQKGIPDLYKIWKIIFSKHHDWHIDLYGPGDIKDVLSSDEDFENYNFHIHQPEGDIFKCYLNSSILLHTSIFEPFGLVMPEAMSCGLPVVAFDCPSGPSEIITDGVDGFLIRNRDINHFAERVCLLIESRDLRIKIGQAAIRSSYRFSEGRIMPEWETLFNDLLSKTGK